jgi:tyrosinase
MAIRKDANTLTSGERAEFVNAVLQLKATGIYDQFVLRHANASMGSIHSCPAFLPWHRRFILDYERELQRVSNNPNLGLPYWNWPSGAANASMWDADLLGGNGDAITQVVSSGPFQQGQWTVVNRSGNAAGSLTRAFGRAAANLPTQNEIDQVMAVTLYDTSPWNRGSAPSFRNQIEGWVGPNLHNRGHMWVGGSMLPMTSPNDPVFFMHHCMVDKLWHEWQLRFPNQSYLPVNGGAFGQNLNDPMDSTPNGPIGNRPIDVIDSTALGIQYDHLMAGTPTTSTTPQIAQGQTIAVNGSSVNGNISTAGEIEGYRFTVTAFGSHTVETSGNSDTIMTLYGPDDPTNQLAFNDDGGANLNSRIVLNLSPGQYNVRIALFDQSATGAFALQVTGGVNPALPQLAVNGAPLNASIGAASESDAYRFQADSLGLYVIETSGATDTFLTIFGPNSQTNQIAQNDDGGFNLNSRVSIELTPGEYFIRVRHFSSQGTGPYAISVKRT